MNPSAQQLLTRRQALTRLGMAGLVVAGAGKALTGCGTSGTPGTPSETGTPNVLLIIADDMRYDHLPFTPNAQRLIADEGRSFTQARCNVPLCQPSRVQLFTGQLSKHNNELGIGYAGTNFDHANTLGTWMSDAGYRCGLFGKYINATDAAGGIDAPPGYDVWREIIVERGAYDLDVHLNEGTTTITDQYSTDYLAAEAIDFLESDGPTFCIVTPTQPHAPSSPRRDLADDYLDVVWPLVLEEDVSDKPSWIQALEPLTADEQATIRRDVIGAAQELAAVDDMVETILSGLDEAVLADTVVIFTSDNGVHHGEHRRRGAASKSGPYDVGLHVPLLIRGPGFAPGPDITAPVLPFQDIPATVLALGGATAGLPHQAGISLAAMVADPVPHEDRILLHEIGGGFVSRELDGATGDGITTGPDSPLGFRKLYRYPSVRKRPEGPFTYEAYDLDTDPEELSNWADDPARRAERDALEAQLVALRTA